MERNKNLLRELLLEIEKKDNIHSWIELSFDDYSKDEIDYHVRLLSEAGFIKANFSMDGSLVQRLTWEGHEFLDSIKNQSVWCQVKEVIKEKGGDISIAVLKSLALNISKKHFLE